MTSFLNFLIDLDESAMTLLHSMYIGTVSSYLGTLVFVICLIDFFLDGLSRNWMYSACCSGQTAYKPVHTSSARKKKGAKSLLS